MAPYLEHLSGLCMYAIQRMFYGHLSPCLLLVVPDDSITSFPGPKIYWCSQTAAYD